MSAVSRIQHEDGLNDKITEYLLTKKAVRDEKYIIIYGIVQKSTIFTICPYMIISQSLH